MFSIERVLINSKDHEVSITCAGQHFLITTADFDFLGISEGDNIDEDLFEQIASADNRLSCIKKAFTHLSYSDVSSRKLSDKLRTKFDKETVSCVVELLTERGYINDVKLAEKYARSFYEFKLWGPSRIKSDLFSRGFSAEDISEACSFLDELDHRENIIKLIEEKFGRTDLKLPAERQKISTFLYRYGYSYSDISDAVSSIESD